MMLTRAEILEVYAAGPTAVVALVESLQALVLQQQAQIAALTTRVQELEVRVAHLSTTSHNSSKPPASDLAKPTKGALRRTRSLRQASGRRPGGQPGHPAHRLQPVPDPDAILEHHPQTCTSCGTSLCGRHATCYQARQVHELPPLRLHVTEHRAAVTVCPHCQASNYGAFPPAVTQVVQYGERLKAVALYLLQYQLLPVARTHELLRDLCTPGGSATAPPVALTPAPRQVPDGGTLAQWVAQCHARLAPVEAAIRHSIQAAPVAHFDETSVRLAGRTVWCHQAGTQHATHYAIHPRRGAAATEEIGVLGDFHGTGVHDAWSAYFQYGWRHALCNAHLLRELTFIHEQTGQAWAAAMKKLLCRIKDAVAQAQRQGQSQLAPAQRQRFRRRYQELLQAGLAANPPPPRSGRRGRTKQSEAKNLLDRMTRYQDAVLRFMEDLAVPFDNNLAERDLRMVKVRQKISGCFRSAAGADAFCRIRSYISTLRKQGCDVLTALASVYSANPYIPPLCR